MNPVPDPALSDALARIASLAVAVALNIQDTAMSLVREGFSHRPKLQRYTKAFNNGLTIHSEIPYDYVFGAAIKIYGFNLTLENVKTIFLQCYPILWDKGLLPQTSFHEEIVAFARSGVIHEVAGDGLRATFTNVTSHNSVMQDLLLAVTHEEEEKGSELTKQDVIGPYFWKILQRLLRDSPEKRNEHYGIFFRHFSAIVEAVISMGFTLFQLEGAAFSQEEVTDETKQVSKYVFAGFNHYLPLPKD